MSDKRLLAHESEDTEQYCYGLPLVQLRPLAPDECAAMQARARGLAWAIARTSFIYPAIFITAFARAVSLPNPTLKSEPVQDVFATIFILGLMLGIPMAMLRTRDLVRRRKAYMATLAQGSVRRFEGKPAHRAGFIEKKLGVKIDDPEQPFVVEMLTGGDAIYRIQGWPGRRWLELNLTYATSRPANPAYFQIPKEQLLDRVEESPPYLARRRLTDGEIDELLFYSRRIRRKYWLSMFVFMSGGGVARVVSKGLSVSDQTANHVGIVVGVVVMLLFIRRIWSISRAFRHDAEYGWSIRYDPESNPDDREGDGVVEYLPASHTPWVVENMPADWRHKGVIRDAVS